MGLADDDVHLPSEQLESPEIHPLPVPPKRDRRPMIDLLRPGIGDVGCEVTGLGAALARSVTGEEARIDCTGESGGCGQEEDRRRVNAERGVGTMCETS